MRKPVVVVTGASRGIGLAAATVLLDKFGAAVVALSRTRSSGLDDLAARHGRDSFLAIQVDLADEDALNQAFTSILNKFQHIDGLILNAGLIDPMGRIASPNTDLKAWRQLFEVNVFSLITALAAAVPALRQSELGGRVVFVSSGAATGGLAGAGAYSASKASMNSICRTLAAEEPDIVSVALRPGRVNTTMQDRLRIEGKAHLRPEDHKTFQDAYEGGKLVSPEDAGHIVASLSLHAAKDLNGQFISWDSESCKDHRRN